MAVGLGSIAETLKDVVGDLSSLDVTTFTGDINVVVKSEEVATGKDAKGEIVKTKKHVIQWDQFMNTALGKDPADVNVKVTGDMQLVLATHVKIDGDAIHFVTSKEIPDYVLKTHGEAVKNGLEYRNQIINFLGGKVAGLLD